jgi:hypothetical protein
MPYKPKEKNNLSKAEVDKKYKDDKMRLEEERIVLEAKKKKCSYKFTKWLELFPKCVSPFTYSNRFFNFWVAV